MHRSPVHHPTQRLRFALGLLALVTIGGALGYHFLAHLGALDSLYMAVTTLFTVGFREMGDVNAATKIFTIVYLITGLGVATYAVSNLTALIVEGDLQGYLRERRMNKRLDALQDHLIVCGFGKMGFQAAWEFKQAGVPFVIIEKDETKGRTNSRFEGDLFVYGNAIDELVLERAGIRRARGLVTTLTTDADNVLVTLTAKQMAPGISVVARVAKIGIESKLRAAGCDHIVSPYEIGGRRMAALLMNADLVQHVDVLLQSRQLELALEQLLVHPESPLAGHTMREVRLRDTTGALVVGLQRPDGQLLFNPKGDDVFQPGDVILAMGGQTNLDALAAVARGDRPA